MQTLKWFLRGAWEFRRDITLRAPTWQLRETYDRGREWAHRLTLRQWDDAW